MRLSVYQEIIMRIIQKEDRPTTQELDKHPANPYTGKLSMYNCRDTLTRRGYIEPTFREDAKSDDEKPGPQAYSYVLTKEGKQMLDEIDKFRSQI